jgi:hypothetical protein
MRRRLRRPWPWLLVGAWLAAGAGMPAETPPPSPPVAPPVVSPTPLRRAADAVASYDLNARLDPVAKTVAGTLRLTWRNPSSQPVGELWFHLYLNAFKDRESTFWQESGGQLRGDRMPEDGWGRIDVTAMRLAGGADLLAGLVYEAPDDGNARDRTLARVPLPQPVPPGGEAVVDIAFTSHLPKVFARTGYHDDFFLVGQWFPKLAVYEPESTATGGRRGGWSVHQFHAWSEFYADFGTYRAALTVPSRFVVGATGQRTGRRDNGDGTTTHTYEQANVHDFAWTASPQFVEIVRRFDAATAVTAAEYAAAAARLDRSVEQLRLDDVEVRLLLQPRHQPQAERYLAAAMHGIEHYGLAFGPYPHRTLTIVDPPIGAEGAGGMEYPTFITAGTTPTYNTWPFDRVREPEVVVLHEYAHQYFQGLLASNEFEEPWLDEGFTTWATMRAGDDWLGRDRSLAELFGLRVGLLDLDRYGNNRGRRFERMRQPSWTYDNGYAFNAYSRPALMLATLEGLVGEQTMARIMRTYAERWRFRHPYGEDFFAVASEVAGRDLRTFFRQATESPAIVDYAVRTIEHTRARTSVTVRRDGDLQMPVVVSFRLRGKPEQRRTWDGVDRWTRFTFEAGERVECVDVDPERRIALDVSWLNNGKCIARDDRPALAMTSRWLLAVQQVLGWLAL